jgi:hypothetical protein
MRFLAEDLWTVIERMGNRGGPRRIAVAFVSCDDRFRLQPGDMAIVNASDDAIRAGQTSAAVLDAARAGGVKQLYSNARLHAKVIITSKEVLVGSANLSQNSPSLVEAAVVSADVALHSAAVTWWDRILEESVRIDDEFLKRIKQIPVERHGGGRSGKPTLSDALAGNVPVLKDYLYGWYEESGEVSRRVVVTEARKKGLLPARTPSRSWGWYEWKYEPGLLERIRSDCQGKPGIDSRAVINAEGEIIRFTSVEPKTWSFIGAIRVTGRRYDAIIMVTLRQAAPGLRLSGPHWRSELAKRLTRGLERYPGLNRRISNRATCLIELGELLDLYRAGRALPGRGGDRRAS